MDYTPCPYSGGRCPCIVSVTHLHSNSHTYQWTLSAGMTLPRVKDKLDRLSLSAKEEGWELVVWLR